jgi:hypothetical protein
MPAEDENCYKLSRVLCEEFEALRPGCFANVDTRQARDEKKKRQEAYKVAHNLGLSALRCPAAAFAARASRSV